MSNIILGWPNRADLVTLSGGSWTSLDNLKDRNTYTLARSTNTNISSTQFDIDLGTTDFSLRALTLHSHNLSVNASWRVTIGTTAGGDDVYDSGTNSVWDVSFDTDLFQFDQSAYWSDTLNDQNIRSQFSIITTFGDIARPNQYIRVEILDAGNSDGYVEIGRLGVWSGFQPTYNAVYGLQHGWQDESDVGFAQSGEMNYEKKKAKRTANLAFDFLSDSEAGILYELMRRSGITGEVMYIPNPADLTYSQRYGFRGTLRRLGGLERTSLNLDSLEIQAMELI